MNEINNLPFVRWVGIYQPAYKISPHLLSVTGSVEVRVEVFTDGTDGDSTSRIAAHINNIGGK